MVARRAKPVVAPFTGVTPEDGCSSESIATVGTTGSDKIMTLVPIVPVRVTSKGSVCVEVYGLLDQGSEVTLIDKNDANRLGLEGEVSRKRFSNFHKQDPAVEVRRVDFGISST